MWSSTTAVFANCGVVSLTCKLFYNVVTAEFVSLTCKFFLQCCYRRVSSYKFSACMYMVYFCTFGVRGFFRASNFWNNFRNLLWRPGIANVMRQAWIYLQKILRIRYLFPSRIMTQLCGTKCTHFIYNFMYWHLVYTYYMIKWKRK